MEFEQFARFQSHMADLQPHVPGWCKSEKMELSVPQKELWHRVEDRVESARCGSETKGLPRLLTKLCSFFMA